MTDATPFAFAEGADSPDREHSHLLPEGRHPPFVVFIPSMQEYWPQSFETFNEADTLARILCEMKGDLTHD